MDDAMGDDAMGEPKPPASAPSSAKLEPGARGGARGSAACAELRDTVEPPSCWAISRRMSAGERSEAAAAPCS